MREQFAWEGGAVTYSGALSLDTRSGQLLRIDGGRPLRVRTLVHNAN
jgi:hypothetical protein